MFKRTTSLVALSVISAISSAQEAGRIEAGQFDIIPTFNSSLSYVDNVAYARDGEPKIYSWRATLSPEIIAATEIDGNPVQFGYRLERGVYFSSSADDYTDHFVEATGEYELNSRHRLSGTAQYEDGHEDRGTGFSLGAGDDITSPDTFKSIYAGAEYSYGALTSNGMLTLKSSRQTLDYDREEQAYLLRDRASNKIGAEFAYKIAPATALVLDVTNTYVRYDRQESAAESRDSDVMRILAGVKWESTAATTGFAKVGYTERDFESATRSTFNDVNWEAGIDWQPLTYSTFRFATSADTRETNGEGNFISGRDYTVSWDHEWLERLSTTASIGRYSDEYVLDDEGIANREDDLMRYTAALNYQARRYLSFSLYYTLNDRDSNRDTIGYDRSVIGLSAEVSL
ncbi:outer membrane beta-barrel protein [Alteromonas stellipolaris]|uniref:outer membrane beta-barrel protein n=1 Tax=Alteromonas stellipolaris TaxID=233316 RepID=UPI0026E41E9C|nr:outer membrane beta-barrel protein [Alteromonas stellipolaris]MDO6539780.1 outer membrane beta-barrel protein [Alteromonas stellipolaris]